MPHDVIKIRGARQNNLMGVDVDVPRNRLVAITGVSGSGKSSLAFDTLFREGQRRFLETLSAYARQFLGRMEKPDVDHIEGLSPAIAVDQQALQRGPRSTVGTITEIVDHLRVLFARAGVAHCPEHGEPLAAQTTEEIARHVAERFDGDRVLLLAPLIRDRKGQHRALLADLAKRGFVRVRVDGEVHRIEDVPELGRYHRHTIEVVVDRLKLEAKHLTRLREAIETAVELSKGDVLVAGTTEETRHSTLRACPVCGREVPPLEPRLFSFNSPHGACGTCEGLGVLRQPSTKALIADPAKSIRDGALAVTQASGGALLFPRVSFRFLTQVAAAHGFDLDTPWRELDAKAKRVILDGTGEDRYPDAASWNGARSQGSFEYQRRYRGVRPSLERAWRQGGRKKQVERFLDEEVCPDCGGSRLNEVASAVTVGGLRLQDFVGSAIGELDAVLDACRLSAREARIAEGLLREVRRRNAFLRGVGLEYLSLDRGADTLSGGEAQRIRLAAQLGAGLQGVLYVLDEPSIGLHPRDHGRLFTALERLRDAGNTVVVVEHDEATLRKADWLIDIGPAAGRHGGRLMGQGPPASLAQIDSPTGRLLRGELIMPTPDERRRGNGKELRLEGARGFHLKDIDVAIPLGTFTVVTGVSGSGKSTLVHHTLERAITRHLGREAPTPVEHDRIAGLEHIEELVFLSSAPIGRTPRSNPATYTGTFTPIRDLFASLPEARLRGWGKGRFSFNTRGGRCETCQGAGAQLVELQFLAPVTVQCPECGGHRFQEATLDVRYRGHSIADVLELTVADALELFVDHPPIARPLAALAEVGLGYLSLGQPSTTLSGGEAQRVKLASHLKKRSRRHTLYILDEPTTGLHALDVQRLVGALQALVDLGHSVLVIEHNLDVVRAADHVIDLGPEGGVGGGHVIATGTPEEIEAHATSATGAALRAEGDLPLGVGVLPDAVQPSDTLRIRNARTHNLKGIDVDIPRDSLAVITGPSGSGKSSLALDTIHAAGRQRFVESLSTYARQFLASRDRPPVDSIEGLGPSVSVEARTSRGHPRSTIATTTEIHDLFRVLWSRAGDRRCPEHGTRLTRTDASALARRLLKSATGAKAWVLAPIWAPERPAEEGDLAALPERLESWRQAGFVRALVDDREERLEGPPAEVVERLTKAETLDLVIDRLPLEAERRTRLVEAIEQAEAVSGGRFALRVATAPGSFERHEHSTRGACPTCGFHLEADLEPRHFSFNTHVGACPACDGLGNRWSADPALLITRPDAPLVLIDGGTTAIEGKIGRYLTKGKGYYEHLLRKVAKTHRIDLSKPFERLDEAARALLLSGTGANRTYRVDIEKEGSSYELHESFTAAWPGLLGHVDAWHKKSEDPEWSAVLENHMRRQTCPDCRGERLAPGPRHVTVGKLRLPQALALSVDELLAWLAALGLSKSKRAAVDAVIVELSSRVELLVHVGLGYLTLDRTMSTLSGGEARRVRLSANLGSQLVGVCYVLDEPTVGLHPADVDRLIGALKALRDGGNTVLVVEHDERMMRAADTIVDIGPGAGRHGGELVAIGTAAEIEAVPHSLTGAALRGDLRLESPKAKPPIGNPIQLTGATVHNLKRASFGAYLGQLTGVCGPSGSGKSSLVLECFVPAIRGEPAAGRWKRVSGLAGGRRVLVVDASPIGRTPASIPATAVGLLESLRELFLRLPEARMRGYTRSHFSFNSKKGRCPACDGRGSVHVEMQFLADLWLPCEECEGRRYRPEILEVRYRNKSIADVLALSVEEAAAFLEHVPTAKRILATLLDVGLGYLPLDQSSTTLSSGEAQRIKLAAELTQARQAGGSVIVLDEPTTGLAKSDVVHLARVLRRLADRGDAVIVIEHHTDLLTACDRLVELGPAGGAAGGHVIAEGTPRQLAADPQSITGRWLFEPRRTKPKAVKRRQRTKKGAVEQ
ncbi:MAG: excinuclease ABC subunit UvrA [Planctomycetota bacterium]